MSTSADAEGHGSSPSGWSPRRTQREKSLPRALGLTALSGIVPGLGLLFTPTWRLGALALTGVVLLVGGLIWRFVDGGLLNTAVDVASSSSQLLLLAAKVQHALLAQSQVATFTLTARLRAGGGGGFGGGGRERAASCAARRSRTGTPGTGTPSPWASVRTGSWTSPRVR